jgi:hypothetical protein
LRLLVPRVTHDESMFVDLKVLRRAGWDDRSLTDVEGLFVDPDCFARPHDVCNHELDDTACTCQPTLLLRCCCRIHAIRDSAIVLEGHVNGSVWVVVE